MTPCPANTSNNARYFTSEDGTCAGLVTTATFVKYSWETQAVDRCAVLGFDDYPDIAARLHLSDSTVRNYLSDAIGKTGTRNKTEAALLARRNGWL